MKIIVSLVFLAILITFTSADYITIPLRRYIFNNSTLKFYSNSRFLQSFTPTDNNPTSYSNNNKNKSDPTSGYYVSNLANFSMLYYAGEILVGNGKKSFTVTFDTGSNKLILPSKSCIDQKNCKVNRIHGLNKYTYSSIILQGFSQYYLCNQSDGCNSTDAQGEQTYGKGRVSGTFVNTIVSVSGLDPINQSVLLFDTSKNVSNEFSDGSFGLGMYDSKNNGGNSFVSNLYINGLIKNNMFSIYLSFEIDDSEIVFGGYNPKNIAASSKITTHPVVLNQNKDDSQRWALAVKKYTLGDFSQSLSSQKNIAVVNSGYAYLGIEKSIFDNLVDKLKNKGLKVKNNQYLINCNKTLPDMTFTIKDSNNQDIIYNLPLAYYVNNQTSTCSLLIQPIVSNDDVALILGNLFFRRYLTIFSLEEFTISFALSIADPKDNYKNILPVWSIVVIVLAAGFISIDGGYLIFKKCKHKFQQNQLTQAFDGNQPAINNNLQSQLSEFTNKSDEINNNSSNKNQKQNPQNDMNKNNKDKIQGQQYKSKENKKKVNKQQNNQQINNSDKIRNTINCQNYTINDDQSDSDQN